MKIVALLILSVSLVQLLASCKKQSKRIIDKHPNGQVKTEYMYVDKNDTTNYLCIVYYENGKPRYRTEVKEDSFFVGDKISYYNNGGLERIEKLFGPTKIDDSIYDCHMIHFLPNGFKSSEYSYRNNQLDGSYIEYDSLEHKYRSTYYTKERLDRWDTIFYGSGAINQLTFFTHGTDKEFEVQFKENGDSLKWVNYTEFGENGVFRKKWLQNGNIITGTYSDTLRNYVIWKWYSKDNKLQKEQVDYGKNRRFTDPE